MVTLPSLADVVSVKPSGLYRDQDQASRGWGGISLSAGWLADLVKVRVNYVLEIHRDGRLVRSMALPMNPSEIRINRPTATDLKFTLGNQPIREHTRYRHLKIEIKGRSGLQRRNGHNRKGEIVFEQGPMLVREFDAFLDAYQRLAARENSDYIKNPDTFNESRGRARVSLVFRAFDEALHVEVEPDMWERSRNAQNSRHSEEWMLSLKAFGPVKPEVPGNFLGPIAGVALWVAGAINQFNNMLATANNLLRNARSDLEVLREPFRRVRETARVLNEVRESVSDLRAFPRVLLADMGLAAAEFRQAFEDKKGTEDAFGRGFGSGKLEVRRVFNDVAEAEMSAWTALGMLGGGPKTRQISFRRRDQLFSGQGGLQLPYDTEDELRGRAGDLAYQLRAGDTLRSLALVLYGDASRWVEIAERNRLQSARQESDGSPLNLGDLIILPRAGSSALVPSSQLRPEEMFGRDVLLTSGDLKVNAEGTDIDTIVGPPLFEQAIRNRVLTRQGESAAFPAYGLPLLPGDKLTASALGYVASHTIEQLTRDPRTREVPAVGAVDSGDGVALAVQVVPVIGEALTTISSFPS